MIGSVANSALININPPSFD